MSTSMKQYERPVLEAWATWEVLRKLSFKADDIFWIFSQTLNAVPRPGLALNVVLRTQDKEFSVTCSPRLSEGQARRLERQSAEFQQKLVAAEFDEKEMTEILHASYAWKNKADLLIALGAKGFAFPFKLQQEN